MGKNICWQEYFPRHRHSELLRSVGATDDELTEAIAGVDPRALRSLRKLLQVLAQNEAVCSLDYRDHSVGFLDVAQVRRSLERLAQENIHEEEHIFYGEFQACCRNDARSNPALRGNP